jgi:hypothetical protein
MISFLGIRFPRHHRAKALAFVLALAVVTGSLCGNANHAAAEPAREQGLLCRSAVRQAEAGMSLPPYLLGAIARVESGRADPATGRFHPWPWTINSEGRGHFFETKAEAVAFAKQLQARGLVSLDVGCLQVNLMHHPDAFQNLEEAFDPVSNARYAVKFLSQLRDKTGSWETASAWYHSANPEEGLPYRGMVVTAMAEEGKESGVYASLPEPGAAVGPLRSVPTGLGTVMFLRGGSSSAILPRSYGRFVSSGLGGTAAGPSAPQTAAPGGGALAGRGLDSYRMQPVAMAGHRLIAAR